MQVASLFFGIVAIVLSFLSFIAHSTSLFVLISAIIGIILGASGISQANKTGGEGRWVAVGGLFTSIASIGILYYAFVTSY